MFSLLLLASSASLVSGFTITFKNYITDSRVPQCDFYLAIGQESKKVASNVGYKTSVTIDVTNTLNELVVDGDYTGDMSFSIQMHPTTAITKLSDESQQDFERYQQPILATKQIASGFGSITEAILWTGVGKTEPDIKNWNMVWTEVFKGTQTCTAESTTTDCFVVNIQAESSDNVNNHDINFNTIADENENLLAGQQAVVSCRVGTENIAINNANTNFRIYPKVECGDSDLVYVFFGDRYQDQSGIYALKLEGPGSSAHALMASLGIVVVSVLFNIFNLY